MKFTDLHSLKQYQDQLQNRQAIEVKIWICGGPGCIANGSLDLYDALTKAINQKKADNDGSIINSIKLLLNKETLFSSSKPLSKLNSQTLGYNKLNPNYFIRHILAKSYMKFQRKQRRIYNNYPS